MRQRCGSPVVSKTALLRRVSRYIVYMLSFGLGAGGLIFLLQWWPSVWVSRFLYVGVLLGSCVPIHKALRRYQVRAMPSRHSVQWLLGAVVVLALGLLMQWLSLWMGKALLMLGLPLAVLLVSMDITGSLEHLSAANIRAERQLPAALALGVATEVTLTLFNEGPHAWQGRVFDEADPALVIEGMPQTITLPAKSTLTLRYSVTAQARGMAHFGGTQVRWQSRWRTCEIQDTLGEPQTLRIYPNFAAVARYAWLSGDRRLAQIGIKSWPRRGQGTDFRQLADYRSGDALRHIDWKASQRHQRPIVREYQDERDQRVIFLLDCGRRMRADEADGSSHFDQSLNALLLLAHVALHEGDEVGAMTFGLPEGQQRDFAPRKGAATLNALMNHLHDIQPTRLHSDCQSAARRLLTLHRRRALVIVLTNFQSDDAPEWRAAMQLLRTRHLVVVASLRERVLADMAQQPLLRSEDAVDVAAAHLFEQTRRDAFARSIAHDALSIDVEPAQLAVALVNRYHAIKRAGVL